MTNPYGIRHDARFFGLKKAVFISLFTIAFVTQLQQPAAAQSLHDVVQYVQPLSGTAASTTASSVKHGGGTERFANTIPAVTLPFAMTQWTPQTQFSEK